MDGKPVHHAAAGVGSGWKARGIQQLDNAQPCRHGESFWCNALPRAVLPLKCEGWSCCLPLW